MAYGIVEHLVGLIPVPLWDEHRLWVLSYATKEMNCVPVSTFLFIFNLGWVILGPSLESLPTPDMEKDTGVPHSAQDQILICWLICLSRAGRREELSNLSSASSSLHLGVC